MSAKKRGAEVAASFSLHPWILPGAAVLAVVVYWGILKAPFVFDDATLPMFHAGNSVTLEQLRQWIGPIRPLVMVTYWVNFAAGGLDPLGYHLGNILLHVVNGMLVFLATRQLLQNAHAGYSTSSNLVAALSAALFLLHPMQSEAVVYVAGRADLLSATFMLGAIFLYARQSGAGLQMGETIAVLLLAALAVASKEQAVGLPVILFVLGNPASFRGAVATALRNKAFFGVLILGGAVASAFVLYLVLTSPSGGSAAGVSWIHYFYTSWRAVAHYFRLAVIPMGQSADHDFPWSTTPWAYGAILALLVLVGLGWFFYRYRLKYPLVWAGFLVSLIAILPATSIIPLTDIFFERRFYFAMFGVCLALSEVLLLSKWKAAQLAMTVLPVCALLAALTYSRCNLWANPLALWSDVIRKAPDKPRGYFWRGELLLNQGRCREAAADLAKFSSLKKSPELNSQVYLGLAYSCSGDGAATVRAADEGIAALGENPKLYWIKARGYALQSRFEDALAAINRAIGLDANSVGYLTTRGSILMAMGRRADAQADLERALQIAPSDADTLRLMNQLRGMR